MTIAIDCRMINSGDTGEYLRGILPSLLRSPHDFLLLGNSAQLESFKQNTNVSVLECDVKPFSLREQFFFPKKILEKINLSYVFYSPSFNIPDGVIIPVYTTIHDIIFPDMPEKLSRIGLAVRMRFYRRAYKKSLIIFTASYFSKSRIEYHLGTKKPIIPVVFFSAGDSEDSEDKLNKYTFEKTAGLILEEMQ
jgi:hypothetical protein